MSDSDYDEVLRQARQLTPGEQKLLVKQLSRPAPQAKGNEKTDDEEKPFRSLADGLRETGFLGSLQDAPSDLATNPKYMEGFGEH